MKFSVFKSNLAKVCADAIALPSNERLREAPGVSETVFKAAGRKNLQKACDEIGYCAVGSAVPTLAYKLDANYIIHTIVPTWIDGNHGEYELLASAYLSALQIADLLGCETLAIPLLTYGAEGFDRNFSIEIAKKTVESFYGKNLKKIALIVRLGQKENLLQLSGLTVYTYTKENGKTLVLVDQNESVKIMIDNKKRLLRQISKDQSEKIAAWLRVKENRNKLFTCGILVAAAILEKPEKQKK